MVLDFDCHHMLLVDSCIQLLHSLMLHLVLYLDMYTVPSSLHWKAAPAPLQPFAGMHTVDTHQAPLHGIAA